MDDKLTNSDLKVKQWCQMHQVRVARPIYILVLFIKAYTFSWPKLREILHPYLNQSNVTFPEIQNLGQIPNQFCISLSVCGRRRNGDTNSLGRHIWKRRMIVSLYKKNSLQSNLVVWHKYIHGLLVAHSFEEDRINVNVKCCHVYTVSLVSRWCKQFTMREGVALSHWSLFTIRGREVLPHLTLFQGCVSEKPETVVNGATLPFSLQRQKRGRLLYLWWRSVWLQA